MAAALKICAGCAGVALLLGLLGLLGAGLALGAMLFAPRTAAARVYRPLIYLNGVLGSRARRALCDPARVFAPLLAARNVALTTDDGETLFGWRVVDFWRDALDRLRVVGPAASTRLFCV